MLPTELCASNNSFFPVTEEQPYNRTTKWICLRNPNLRGASAPVTAPTPLKYLLQGTHPVGRGALPKPGQPLGVYQTIVIVPRNASIEKCS